MFGCSKVWVLKSLGVKKYEKVWVLKSLGKFVYQKLWVFKGKGGFKLLKNENRLETLKKTLNRCSND